MLRGRHEDGTNPVQVRHCSGIATCGDCTATPRRGSQLDSTCGGAAKSSTCVGLEHALTRCRGEPCYVQQSYAAAQDRVLLQ